MRNETGDRELNFERRTLTFGIRNETGDRELNVERRTQNSERRSLGPGMRPETGTLIKAQWITRQCFPVLSFPVLSSVFDVLSSVGKSGRIPERTRPVVWTPQGRHHTTARYNGALARELIECLLTRMIWVRVPSSDGSCSDALASGFEYGSDRESGG